MIRRSPYIVMLLMLAGLSLSATAQSYRFDAHLAEAKQVMVTPTPIGVGSRPLFSPDGPLAWKLSGYCPDSQCWTEGDHLVAVTKEADRICSPPLDLELSDVGCLEVELRVEGQDAVQLICTSLFGRRSCEIAVPQQGQFFTARIDPRAQDGWLSSPADELNIGVKGAARLEIRAVRAVAPLLVVPVGVRQHKVGDSLRQTLHAHCPMALEYALRVPPRGCFTVGLAVFASAQPVSFRVELHCGDATTTLLTRAVEASSQWADVEADLSAFAGKDATVTLAASCDTPGQVALWSNPAVLEKRAPGAPAPPNIVYCVVDALRADHLDAYGYGRQTAPAVTALAGAGVRFGWCLSQATWTQVSVPSYHASVGPLVHKVNLLTGESVPPSLVTFPELLRDAGYTTCAVTDNPLSPPKTAPRSAYGTVVDGSSATTSTERATRFLEANRDRPFLLYVHTMEAHCTVDSYDEETTRYEAPPPFQGMFSSGNAPVPADYYDDGVAHANKDFEEVLAQVKALGLAENTIVIFSADHGEAFLEHGMITHGGAPYVELIHVPLVISWPGVLPAGKVFNETVSLLDVAPTILDYASIPIPPQFQGLSLRGLMEGTDARPFQERTVFSHGVGSFFAPSTDELVEHFFLGPMMGISPKLLRFVYTRYFDDVFSAVRLPWALWRKYPDGPTHLYNLELDPGEAADVASQHPETVSQMSGLIDEHRRHEAELSLQLGTSGNGERNTIDAGQKEALEALGYLGH